MAEKYAAQPEMPISEGQAYVPGAPSEPPRARNRGLVIGIIVAVVLALGACGLVVATGLTLLNAGTEMTAEWQQRVDQDYPGWEVLGFTYGSYPGPYGEVSNRYVITARPPGRDYPVGLVYEAPRSSGPVPADEIFRSNGIYDDRAESLFEYLEDYYVRYDKALVAVTSDTHGYVTIQWESGGGNGPISTSIGSEDYLVFDDEAGVWNISPEPYTPEF